MFVRPPTERSHSATTVDAAGMRAHNAGLLLRLVWAAEEGVSRADLARTTGLSRSTVSAIVAELLDAGLVEETEARKGRSGRPPVILRFRDDAFALLGLELGAAHIGIVAMDPRGAVLHRERLRFDVQGDPDGTMVEAHRLVENALVAVPDRQVVGLGVAVPSPVDQARPDELSERILPHWAGRRPARELAARWRLPVAVDNDANLGALAELWWGAARGTDCATYIKVATGVGAGHVLGGRLFRGANGIAGEIGHTAVASADGRPCRCGLTGCLEAEIGSHALLAHAGELGLHPAGGLDLDGLVQAALDGEPKARTVVAEAGRHLGVAIANLVNLMNPERVVIGGRLARADALLLDPLVATMTSRALASSVERTDVRIAELGSDHIALGAATLVLEAALAAPDTFHPPVMGQTPTLTAVAR